MPPPPAAPPAARRPRVPRLLWLILLVAGIFRFWSIDWDQGTLSHPDERHVLMTAYKLRWPSSVPEYLDEARSPLNPRNRETPYFAYGTLPTTMLAGLSDLCGVKKPEQQTLLGRGLSATFDLGVVVLVCLIGGLLGGQSVGLLAAALYATAVGAIQHAHFFVVDPFANFFIALALWLVMRGQKRGGVAEFAGAGLATGLAVACKISIATFGLPAVVAAAFGVKPVRVLWRWLLFVVLAAGAFRLAEPDAFSGLYQLAPRWVGNMREVIGVTQGTADLPFTRQWVGRAKLLFPWENMVIWGLGIPLGLTAWAGAAWGAWRLGKYCKALLLAPLLWIALVFLHQGTQWLMTMRYFLPIYPALCVMAALLLARINRRFFTGFVLLATLLWAIAFMHVYRPMHTRVRASQWIYKHIKTGTALGAEGWDDALPLTLPDTPGQPAYKIVEFPWYDVDSPAKREAMLTKLNEVKYLVLASDKLYGSIPRMPHRYPMTIAYYQALFNGSLGFDLVAEFHGKMNLLGLRIPTESAEEAFGVYDHPPVWIFRKSKRFTPANAREILSAPSLANVTDARWPEGAAAQGDHKTESAILLPAERWSAQQVSGTWSEIFHRDSFVNHHPVVAWVLLLWFLWGVGFPYAQWIFGASPDRGMGLARLMAIGVPLWLLWLLASLQWAPFQAWAWWTLMLCFALPAALLLPGTFRVIRRHWKCLLAAEVVFWAAFALCLTIRYHNPDLWHPAWGGEKPMEGAYLYGVMRSNYFPPYNPWYAGGFINYYYFGFVLCGGLMKAVGIAPEVGFNLCLATFYGLTASAAYSAVRAFAPRIAAIAGAIFVTLSGNLFQAKFIYERLVQLGQNDHELTIPLVSNAIRAFDGLRHVWKGGERLFVYDADPYWVAARAIAVKPGEVQPITEFPYWSYLYADLHPHLIALPFTLAVIAALGAWVRRPTALLFAALAFLLGLFWPTNTWDWPTYGALIGLTFFVGFWRRSFGVAMAKSVALFVGLIIAARLAFLPFYHHYIAGYGSFALWHGERTSLGQYAVIHGFFLLILGVAFSILCRQRTARGPLRALHAWLRFLRARGRMAGWMSRRPDATLVGGGLFVVFLALTMWLVFCQSLPALLAIGLLLALLLTWSRRLHPVEALPFLMAALAFGLSLLVEFVVLEGDVGRMNTVFKFYYQVWALFAVSSAALLARTWRAAGGWRIGIGALFLLSLLYPITATPAKMKDRFEQIPPTLDGMAYMEKAQYEIRGRRFALRGDLAAIRWLQDHVRGTPVVLEMNTGDILYSWGERIAVNTGLPAVVGWDWHERQQQAGLEKSRVPQRIADVQTIYRTLSIPQAKQLIDKYQVGLIVVGELERAFAPAASLQKFARMGYEQIYDADGVTIYRIVR